MSHSEYMFAVLPGRFGSSYPEYHSGFPKILADWDYLVLLLNRKANSDPGEG